jgi:ATPase subunit of ABC transporter with duplicated ATPase domains
VLFVSHDRTFVNMVASQIVEVDDGKVRVVPGTYADYVEQLQSRARASTTTKRSAPKTAEESANAAAMHAERRRKKNERDRATKALKELEGRMAKLAEERAKILAEIESDPAAKKHDLYARLSQIDKDTTAAEPLWLELEAKIEALGT